MKNHPRKGSKPMPLLHQEPPTRIDNLDDLLGIAMAMETEAVRRYRQLGEWMEQRGESGTAATFRTLMAEEDRHVTAVDDWADTLGRPEPDAPAFLWVLPPDIASSWDDLLDRTRLTPYQALSLAVVNEQRAFSFYSYIAAATDDDTVRRYAEAFAQEELRHAALLRRERRKAFHLGNHGGAEKPTRADSPAAFDRLTAALLGDAATRHAALSDRLAAEGDAEGAALLARIAQEEGQAAGTGTFLGIAPALDAESPPWPTAIAIAERLAEAFADIAATTPDETVLGQAQHRQEAAIRHLARLTGFQRH